MIEDEETSTIRSALLKSLEIDRSGELTTEEVCITLNRKPGLNSIGNSLSVGKDDNAVSLVA